MKVTVLDDYQRAFEATAAIQRLRQKVDVRILTEKLPSEAAVADALKGSPVDHSRARAHQVHRVACSGRCPISNIFLKPATTSITSTWTRRREQGIVVSLAPGGNSTTELAFGLMLAVMRRIPQSDRAMRRGEWPLVLGYVLKGKTLGILGLGRIGTEVAAIARAFGMKVIAWGPTLTAERAAKSDATFMPLEDVLKTRRCRLRASHALRSKAETCSTKRACA